MTQQNTPPVMTGGRRIALGTAVAVVILAVGTWLYLRAHRRATSWDSGRLSASIFYVAIGPAPALERSPQNPVGIVRIHYHVRNNGDEDFVFSPDVTVLQREGPTSLTAVKGVGVETPNSIAPAQEAQLVITRPFNAEYLSPDEWSRLYPEREVPPAGPHGLPRLAITVETAQNILAQRPYSPAKLLEHFDIVGEPPARECTSIARAVLARQFPLLTGYSVQDGKHRVQLDLPLPRP